MLNNLLPSEKIDHILRFMQIAQSSDMKRQSKLFKVYILVFASPVSPVVPLIIDLLERAPAASPLVPVACKSVPMDPPQSRDTKSVISVVQSNFFKGNSVERVYSVIPYAPHLLDRFVLKFLKCSFCVMANHTGDIVVVHVVKALWQEFRERNWREFEEFKEVKDQHFRQHHQQRTAMVVGPQSGQQARVVTISNSVATIMKDSMNSEKGYL